MSDAPAENDPAWTEACHREEAICDLLRRYPGRMTKSAVADVACELGLSCETEMPFHCGRQFHSGCGFSGRAVRDGGHPHHCGLADRSQGEDDNAWPILATFFLARAMLVMPQVRVRDDEAKLRPRNRHGRNG